MCVTNIYTDIYPTGEEGIFRQLSLCSSSSNGRPCLNHTEYSSAPRHINYGVPTSAQMFPPTNYGLHTPPQSSESSARPPIGIALGSDDGATLGTGSYSIPRSKGRRKLPRGSKSRAMLDLMNIKVQPISNKKKERKRGTRKEKIVIVEAARPSSYARPSPGDVRFSPFNVPRSAKQPSIPYMPDTPPLVLDAFPGTAAPRYSDWQAPVTRDVSPKQPEMRRNRSSPGHSVSPVRIPESERRSYARTYPPTIIHQQQPLHRNRDPSPPVVLSGASKTPSDPPASPAETPPERSNSLSRGTRAMSPPPTSSRDSRRGPSPDLPSSPPPTRKARNEHYDAERHNAEILSRPAKYQRFSVPTYPRGVFRFERERRPYAAPSATIMETSRQVHDMMEGLKLSSGNGRKGKAALPVMTGPPIDSGVLRERSIPSRRIYTASGLGGMSGVERRREKLQMRWE